MINRITAAALCGLMAATMFGLQGAQAAGGAAEAPPSATPPAPLNGPLVPGVCLLSQAGIIDRSKIGAAAGARLRNLAQQAQSGLDADKAALERRGSALTAERATLPPAQFQAKAQALNQRAQAIQAEAAERTRQLESTRQKVFGLILQDAQPYIAQAFATHGCGLLVSREAVLGGNMTNDLTAEVIVGLDANAAPLSFDLEPPAAPATR